MDYRNNNIMNNNKNTIIYGHGLYNNALFGSLKNTIKDELYKEFNIHVIEAKRNINSNGKKRGKVEEVIITNFENKKGFE